MSSASMKECLQLQLLEMEMLFSMFPNQGEVKLEDVNALTNIKRYLEGTREALPPKIEFEITLQIDEPKVGVLSCFNCCQVPSFYWKHLEHELSVQERENIPDVYFLYLFESKICKTLDAL